MRAFGQIILKHIQYGLGLYRENSAVVWSKQSLNKKLDILSPVRNHTNSDCSLVVHTAQGIVPVIFDCGHLVNVKILIIVMNSRRLTKYTKKRVCQWSYCQSHIQFICAFMGLYMRGHIQGPKFLKLLNSIMNLTPISLPWQARPTTKHPN